jgi:hypothetical protein
MEAMEKSAEAITIRDIARNAGVSTATVSRVLNGASGVLPATQSAVLEVVRLIAYKPKSTRRGTRKTQGTQKGHRRESWWHKLLKSGCSRYRVFRHPPQRACSRLLRNSTLGNSSSLIQLLSCRPTPATRIATSNARLNERIGLFAATQNRLEWDSRSISELSRVEASFGSYEVDEVQRSVTSR